MEKREDNTIEDEEEEEMEYSDSSSSEEVDEEVRRERREEYEENCRKHAEQLKKRRVYTDDEIQRDLARYDEQILKSEGFDVDSFPSLTDYYGMRFPYANPDKVQLIRDCASLALDHYNKDNGTKYKLGTVLKTTTNCVALQVLKMTFEGKDENGDCKVFQGVVFDGIPHRNGKRDRDFLSVRLKPVPDEQPATSTAKTGCGC